MAEGILEVRSRDAAREIGAKHIVVGEVILSEMVLQIVRGDKEMPSIEQRESEPIERESVVLWVVKALFTECGLRVNS